MSGPTSRYYPPRARWPALRAWGAAFVGPRGWVVMPRLPDGVSVWGGLGSCVVPGLAFCLRWPWRFGVLALGCCGMLVAVFFARLGYPEGEAALGLLLGLHATGLTLLLGSLGAHMRLRFRLVFVLGIVAGLTAFIYVPARDLVERHWLMPLSAGGKVVVVRRVSGGEGIRRGDTLAARVEERGGGNLRSLPGYVFGPVLALPGDRVRFEVGSFAVNGVRREALAHMPEAGEVVVPENCWLIWPEIGIRGEAYASAERIASLMLQLGMVRHEDVVGRPFDRWFLRRQMPL